MRDIPAMIAAATVIAYWLGVATMVIRRRLLYGRSTSGVVPLQVSEWIVWPLWTAVITAWIVIPLRATRRWHTELPSWAIEEPMLAIRWLAAIVAVVCLAATIRCWREMGRNWSVVVVPGERSDLVTSGLFRFVRHPIYALSIVLFMATALAVPSWPLLLAAAIHLSLMQYKARGEEQFMHTLHGPKYAAYCRQTGRFVPRWHAVHARISRGV